MSWWKFIVLGTSLGVTTMGMSAHAETFVQTRWKSMSLSFGQCIKEAKAVLEVGHFDEKLDNSKRPLEDSSGAAWGGKSGGKYKAVIKCLPDQGLVFFVVAGPEEGNASTYASNLFRGFTGE